MNKLSTPTINSVREKCDTEHGTAADSGDDVKVVQL